MRLTLRTRILLLITGTVAGLALLVLFALAQVAQGEIHHAVRQDVEATGRVLRQFIRERSDALLNQSQLLAGLPLLIGTVQTGDAATVTDNTSQYLLQLRADALLVTDRQGGALSSTDSRILPGTRLRHEPGVAVSLEGKTWTGVVAYKERLMLAVSVPIMEPVNKEILGTLTAYRAIHEQVAQELKQTLHSDVAFVYQGRVVGASLRLPETIPTPSREPELATVGNTSYYLLYASLPETEPTAQMGYVTLRPYASAMAPLRRMQTAFLVITVLALALALAAGTFVARNLTHPLDGVVQAARLLRAGSWPEPFAAERSDEIGLLQTVFNEMTHAMKSSQERLLALIDTDPLTELDNHRQFQERLVQEAKRCAASGEALTLLLFDLDHFQHFNQQHGHAAGDEALKKVALILQNCLPEVAILARYGGEEFAALLPGQDTAQAEAYAERARTVVMDAYKREGIELTLSVGCAEFGTHSTQPEELALAAELAVSQAKQLGRNRVCTFDSVSGADQTANSTQLHQFLKDGSLATIQALAAAVDAKDTYTQGHSRRVALYACELAKHIGMAKEEIELLHITGTLHDVGKIGVPDNILKKPGRLDEEERTVMETHPVLGEVIVRKAPQLSFALPGVRHHHERWDGRGYPDKLAGETIPFEARILAVADTFDAMTSDRPYRKGLAVEIALAEIEKNAGTQFDPELAPAFVTMMRAKGELAKAA